MVATHDLERVVLGIGDCVKADQGVGHRDIEELGYDLLPVVNRLIVKVCPVEIECLVEFSIGAGIGEVHGFFRFHSHENLNQREDAGEYAFVGILFYLVVCAADGDAAPF